MTTNTGLACNKMVDQSPTRPAYKEMVDQSPTRLAYKEVIDQSPYCGEICLLNTTSFAMWLDIPFSG